MNSQYRQKYFEFSDSVASAITDRFSQDGFDTLIKMEQILVGNPSDEDVDSVCSKFHGDLNSCRLRIELPILRATLKGQIRTVDGLRCEICEIKSSEVFLPEVRKLVTFLYDSGVFSHSRKKLFKLAQAENISQKHHVSPSSESSNDDSVAQGEGRQS